MDDISYRLDDQIGFLLRRVNQRHLAIFAKIIPEVTTTQFALMARLSQLGPQSQNALGRETAMDAATVKGVVDRLARQGFVTTADDPNDRRRRVVSLTEAGETRFRQLAPLAQEISRQTQEPLSRSEARMLFDLLSRLT